VGATPVFVDIDGDTFNINIKLIERAITPRTKAIMPVHEFGLACAMGEIKELAVRYNLKVIEDAACALGAAAHGKYAGCVGDVGSFSFHPRKAITSGEGGMLVTNDDALDKKLRILRNHGVEYIEGRMEFTHPGFNYRMTDFQAALVKSQLPRLNDIIEKKNALAQVYLRELGNCEKIQLPVVPPDNLHTWQSFHVVLDDSVNRDQLILRMKDHGVGTNLGAQCMPSQKYFQAKYNLDSNKLYPNALRTFNHGLVLPLYQQLDEQQIAGIASTLKNLIC
jgi:perosamine synthetase